jgi:RNAse P Rpr2/Rpp21/SNM1 subunit domain
MNASARAANLKTTFLEDAAKSIATTSPSTASYLASESVQLKLDGGPQDEGSTDQQRQTFCTACGSVFIPGWNCLMARGDKVFALNTPNKARRHTISYRCLACHYRTDFILPSPKRVDSKKQVKNVVRSAAFCVKEKHPKSSDPTTTPMKTSSKKKAKARREKAGLQSLLKKSKEETIAPPQLSLMDFMMA